MQNPYADTPAPKVIFDRKYWRVSRSLNSLTMFTGRRDIPPVEPIFVAVLTGFDRDTEDYPIRVRVTTTGLGNKTSPERNMDAAPLRLVN